MILLDLAKEYIKGNAVWQNHTGDIYVVKSILCSNFITNFSGFRDRFPELLLWRSIRLTLGLLET